MIRKILLGFGVLVILAVVLMFASIQYNKNLPPPPLVTNFVDLKQVRQISKYRSCAGHTVVPQDGSDRKRNMKHYITLYPEYQKEDFVEVYAPYDGYVALLFGKEEIWLASGKRSWLGMVPVNRWMFSVTHVKPRKDLKIGSKVKAGDVIGYGTFAISEPGYPGFDVVYGTLALKPKKLDNWMSVYGQLDSVFNHMTPAVLAEYEQKGVTLENIIVSKEERDNDPCVYRDGGPYFEHKDGSIPGTVDLKK